MPRIKSYTHNTNLKLLYEHVALLNSKAAEETRPTDLAMAADGSVLYTLSGGEHRIGVYKIQRGATLQKLESLDVLPIGVTGLMYVKPIALNLASAKASCPQRLLSY